MPVIDMIPELIAIAKEHDTPTATRMIKKLFAEHHVQTAEVRVWTQEEMDATRTAASYTPEVEATKRTPGVYATEQVGKPDLTQQFLVDGKPVRQAGDKELREAMKRLGYGDPTT